MEVIKTKIAGLFILEPRVFVDERGSFTESYNKQNFEKEIGYSVDFVQDNQSVSRKNVLRGLHFQKPPFAQGKLVRVIKGAVLDVAVDIRKGSETYGQHVSVELSADNNRQFWVPAGFAHGFVALEEDTIFAYKCTNYYAPASEGTLLWNDKDLAIDWKVIDPLISDKDAKGEEFSSFVTEFA